MTINNCPITGKEPKLDEKNFAPLIVLYTEYTESTMLARVRSGKTLGEAIEAWNK
jgi:hypothetical protein